MQGGGLCRQLPQSPLPYGRIQKLRYPGALSYAALWASGAERELQFLSLQDPEAQNSLGAQIIMLKQT